MNQPELKFITCPDTGNGHRMAYWQWGQPQAPYAIVCAHGLTRQGRDFDVLARALVARSPTPLRVICPDVVGRGRSDWLADPAGYQVPTYVDDMVLLLAQLQREAALTRFDWVGTSMGGLIGLGLLGTPGLPLPCAPGRLVLNDVGPVLEWQAIQRIASFVGKAGRFETVQQAADAMWAVSTGFGPHTPEQWLALSEPLVKPVPEGGWMLRYDPAIGIPFGTATEQTVLDGEAALWALYDALRLPCLLLRGEQSDLLSPATAKAMTERGPRARLCSFAGVGHAPTLIADDQVQAVTQFLLTQ